MTCPLVWCLSLVSALDEIHTPAVVHAVITRRSAAGTEVLLMLRARTGRADGTWAMPAGRVEPGESPRDAVVREVREEIGIEIDAATLEIVSASMPPLNDGRDHRVIRVRDWRGEACNREPASCDAIRWCSVDRLPEPMLGFVRAAIAASVP